MTVVQFKRKLRPLRATWDPRNPFQAEKVDQEDGSITYEIMDMRPDTYGIIAFVHEEPVDDELDIEDRGNAFTQAIFIVRALNFYHNAGGKP